MLLAGLGLVALLLVLFAESRTARKWKGRKSIRTNHGRRLER